MWSQLGFSRCIILLHNITHISSFDFTCILSLLICSPVSFSLFLLSGKFLVISLHVFKHLILTSIILVFHHASHGSDGSGLFGILFGLKCIVLILPLMLSGLFLDPLFLQLCIWGNTVAVAYKINKQECWVHAIWKKIERVLVFKRTRFTYLDLHLQIICSLRYIPELLLLLNRLFQLFSSYLF